MTTALNQGATPNAHDWLNEHGDYLFRFALVRLRDEHLAEDAVQETLLAAIKNSAGFTGKSSARTWLTGILKHKIIDLMRRAQREQPLYDEDVAEEMSEPGMDEFFDDKGHWSEKPCSLGDPAKLMENQQFWQILQNCLDRLPKNLARLFMLREIEEEDNESICKELEISATNAWVMLYRSRMGLRKCMEMRWAERSGM
ncbi:MAG: sigma-70 family RNA polymerase sigma factor [Methylophilaceae bacterium]